jgi:hypothetical protein
MEVCWLETILMGCLVTVTTGQHCYVSGGAVKQIIGPGQEIDVRNLIKRSAQSVLARFDLSVINSERLGQLLSAEELLPETDMSEVEYVSGRKIGNVGFSINMERQCSFLQKISGSEFRELFLSLRTNPDINIGFAGVEFRSQGLIHNGYYPTPDAELYAALIAEFRPVRIIEIGSGYSTLIAHHTLRHLGISAEIHIIDPQPRRDISNYASEIEYKRVQDSSFANIQFSKSEPSILFIDSSHVTKMGGDIPFLFCEMLPNLPAGVLVHVHDIFTPFDYPANYGRRFYTEQYVLQALLANSSKFSVRFSTYAMSRECPAAMQAVFGQQVGRNPLFFGASFWLDTLA